MGKVRNAVGGPDHFLEPGALDGRDGGLLVGSLAVAGPVEALGHRRKHLIKLGIGQPIGLGSLTRGGS